MFSKTFSILDVSYFYKAKLLSKLCLIGESFIFISYNLIYVMSDYFNWSDADRLSPDYFQTFNFIYVTLILLNLLHLTYSGWVKTRPTLHNTYMYASLTIYVVTHSLLCHLLGELSINTGIMMTASPLIGLILFNVRGVIWGALVGSTMVIGGLVATLTGYLDYAPLIDGAYPIYQNTAFILFTLAAVSPHVLIVLLLGYHTIQNWKAREALSVQNAETDTLTNIPNRRKFGELMGLAISQCKHKNSNLGLIMLDIDHFKQINDDYGHLVGDRVLNGAIAQISSSLRHSDVIARYGGDEFVVIMPGASLKTVAEAAERCIKAIRDTSIEVEGEQIKLTASLGVTSSQISSKLSHAEFSRQLIKVADDALLVAKKRGRNRIQIGMLLDDDERAEFTEENPVITD
jgi:diguanylate cyclase (GGDEF)-like protein